MARFPSTQWSLIRLSGTSSAKHEAFGELARAYRAAILAFFRAHMDASSAEDATQSFLTLSYEHAWWSRADAAAGSFRGFLLLLLRRHLGHLREHRRAATEELTAACDLSDGAPPAADQFDVRFVLVLTARAIDIQRARYRERDKGPLFESLLPLLGSPPEHGQLKAIAQSLQLQPNTLTIEVRRLRERMREALRAQVMDLCLDETAFAGEWAAVQRILGGMG